MYKDQWEEYNKLDLYFMFFFVGFITALICVFLMPDVVESYRIAFGVVASGLTMGMLTTGRSKTHWPCPRCHKPFQPWQSGNPLGIGSKCVHCGLPKWSAPKVREK